MKRLYDYTVYGDESKLNKPVYILEDGGKLTLVGVADVKFAWVSAEERKELEKLKEKNLLKLVRRFLNPQLEDTEEEED